MKSNFSRLWKISDIVYRELCFQSLFSLRMGAALPRMKDERTWKLVGQAKTNMLLNKVLVTIFMIIITAFSIGYSSFLTIVSGLREELVIAASVSVYLMLVFFLIFMVGLQVTTSLVSTKAFEALAALPISRKDVSKIAFLSFFRIFDLPLVSALIVFPIVYSVFMGSFFGGLASLMAVAISESFALALTVGLAKFFYAKIAGGGGSSKYRAILRFFYMLVWLLPTFGVYLIINFAFQFFQFLSSSFAQISSLFMNLLALIYPFSLGFLVSFATLPSKLSYPIFHISLISSFIYLAIGYLSLKYTGSVIRRACIGSVITAVRRVAGKIVIKPVPPWLGIILKDLRIASRTPAYASIVLLPIVQTVIIVVSLISSNINLNEALILGILSGLSFFTLIVTPTLFADETLASAYTRSLPLRRRTIIMAKATLTTLIYLISVTALSIILLLLGKNFIPMLTYGLVHALSMMAASITELAIMVKKFWRKEIVISNIYAQLTMLIITIVPGMTIALIPIIAGIATYYTVKEFMLPIYLTIAITEFLIAITFTKNMKN